VAATLEQLEAVYRSRLAEFRRVASAIVADVERGRDSVQEAFVTAVRRRSSFRGDGPLEAWLWRIVISHARDEARRRPALALTPDASISMNGTAAADGRLAAAVAALSERQRLVLFLRYYADLDYAAIARTLDIAPGTVAATLNKIHAALRQSLEEVRQ
jgi:RNA polymerase sigma-70 factor, ECF subfamily